MNETSYIHGYCIHCHEPIPLNKIRPFCSKCFNVWKSFLEEDKIENFCHCCGNHSKEVSFGFPICSACNDSKKI